MTEIKESVVETHFVKQVKLRLGTESRKYKTRRADPDRLVLLDGGEALFVELKRPGEEPRPEQLREHKRLRDKGFSVTVIDTKEGVDAWIDVVIARREDRSKDQCPDCGKGMLLFSSMKIKTCNSCRKDFPWPLNEGQKPLVCASRG
jgi:predicted RNA-binding Zn-ribbon protein involved in translation (DUF1610 family)